MLCNLMNLNAVGCRIGFEKHNYSRIQKRMGERFFAIIIQME